jgi:hypothetical protein
MRGEVNGIVANYIAERLEEGEEALTGQGIRAGVRLKRMP